MRIDLAGYQAIVVRDAYDAIGLIRTARPAVMVLDLNTPDFDGFSLLRRLKITGAAETMAIMVMSTNNNSSDVQRALAFGAQDFLAKPFSDQEFLDRLARLLKKRGEADKKLSTPR